MIFVSSLPTQNYLILPGLYTTPKQKESRLGVWTASQRPPRRSSSTKLIGTSRSTVMIIVQTFPRKGRTLLNRKPRTVGPNQSYQTVSPHPCLAGGLLVQPLPPVLPLLSQPPRKSRRVSQRPFSPTEAYPVPRMAWVSSLRARTWPG